MKILIDARLYGLENAGVGRYLINLIEELQSITDRPLDEKKQAKDEAPADSWFDYAHHLFEPEPQSRRPELVEGRPGYLLPTLRREQNPSEAEIASHSSTDLRPWFSAKGDKFIILLRKKYFNELNLPEGWKKVLADFGHYTFGEQLKLPRIISKENPDLTHFPHFNLPIRYKGKFIVTIHDMTMHRQGRIATKLPLPIYYAKRLPYKYIFRKAVLGSSGIIVPSKSVKRDLIEYFGINKDKVTVAYEGLSKNFLEQEPEKGIPSVPMKYKLKGNKYLLYVGNVYPHKNVERVVEAVKYLNKEKNLSVIFAVASSSDYFTKRLKREVEKQNAQKYVRLLGFVPDEDLVNLYNKSTAFIYPSLAEGFGLPGIEALSAGTLVLASNISVFREIYKDNAFYFNPYDFSSIAKVIEYALKLKVSERKRVISKSQEFIKRYSWSKMAKQTLEVYKEALKPAQV